MAFGELVIGKRPSACADGSKTDGWPRIAGGKGDGGVGCPLSQCAAETAALHAAGALPTRRVRAPYTGGALSLHGGFDFPTRENGISDVKGTLRSTLSGVDA